MENVFMIHKIRIVCIFSSTISEEVLIKKELVMQKGTTSGSLSLDKKKLNEVELNRGHTISVESLCDKLFLPPFKV